MIKVSKEPNGQPEIFYSIQGEGANIGRPAVFLRLAVCNLKCVWCDTKYTWNWNGYDSKEHIVEMPDDEIEKAIVSFGCRYLVVTGGEPLLQQNQLLALLGRLQDNGFYVEIETNGTILPEERLLDLVDHWSVSPKLQSSGNTGLNVEVPQAYRLFAYIGPSHFKFVIQNDQDVKELLSLSEKYGLLAEKVILMPQAQNPEDLLEKSRWLVEICKTHCFRFSTRLHTLLWGSERGR